MTRSILFVFFSVLITGCETGNSDERFPHPQANEPITVKYRAEENYQWYRGSDSRTYTELTLVFVGGYACGYCHDPAMKNSVEDLKVMLKERALEQNMEYSVIGIAGDWDVQKGWEYLNSVGEFDEVIIGRNAVNTGKIEFQWEGPGIPSAPQVIVYKREVTLTAARYLTFGEKEYLANYSGIHAILEWVAGGAVFEDS